VSAVVVPVTAQTVRAEAARVRRASQWIGAALWTVAAGAMVTAAATVTAWALAHGMDYRVAWMVDPLLSVALLAALLGEGVLARHGESGGAWPRVLRWGTGLGTLTANVWAPVQAGDTAGVVLHALAPVLLVILAEAAPRLRLRMAGLAARLDEQAQRLDQADGVPAPAPAAADVAPVAPLAHVAPVSVPVVDVVDDAAPIPAPVPAVPVASSTVRPVAVARVAPSGSGAGLAELRAAIVAGELPAEPSVWAIRKGLRVGTGRAEVLRAELLGLDDDGPDELDDDGQIPGQASVLELVRT
jgi:hypothetical protein